jgi:hypothetical protein
MDATLTDALLAAGTVAFLFCVAIWCLYRVVVWARRRSKRAYIDEVATIVARPTRPALVSIVSVALGLIAGLTAVVLACFLFADEMLLAPGARFARDSLSALDWSSLFAMSGLLLTSMVMFFRLRKSSLYWFGAYLALGVLGSTWYVLTPERELYFDVRVTSLSGLPIAIAVLLYLLRLKRRAVLV